MMPSGVQRAQSPSYDSTESKCQCGASASCIPLSFARLYLICGALCFQRKGTHGYMEQFSSDLLEQVPMQTKYNCVKCLLQCLQVRIQQTLTFKFLHFYLVLCIGLAPYQPHTVGLGSPQGGLPCSDMNSSSNEGMHTQYCPLSPCSESLPLLPILASVSFCNAVKSFGSRGELCSITCKIWLGVCFLLLGCGCTVALT